jgi:hypothetical protein
MMHGLLLLLLLLLSTMMLLPMSYWKTGSSIMN